MMIPHVLITTIDRLRNNIDASCDGTTLPVCSPLVNALCFALSTAISTRSLNLFLPQITPHGCLMTEQNFKPELSKIRTFASLESQIIHSPFLCLEPIWLLVLLGTPARKIIPLHP